MDTLKYLKIGVIVSLIIAIIALFTPSLPTSGALNNGVAGTAGNMLAEQYIPYVQYNGGYNSAKDFSISGSSAFSGATSFTSTFTVGSSGTSFTRINGGTCFVLAYATTIAASSTASVDCQGTAAINLTNTTNATALTGIVNNDQIIANFSTTTATNTSNGIVITGAAASSTSGYITLRVSNLTGTTFTWPTTGTASGTVYYLDLK